MSIVRISKYLLLLPFVFSASAAFAQTTGTQNFTVTVPQSISITAPAAAVITHDETDAAQNFQPQTWVVRGNARNGVNVSFSTATPFVHSENDSFKRDARLTLALGTSQGPAVWALGTATDTTDFATGDGVATVSAGSNGVGRSNLNLSVSFLTQDFGVVAAGNYVTTVTGTIAPK
jgi:hypothetical protein